VDLKKKKKKKGGERGSGYKTVSDAKRKGEKRREKGRDTRGGTAAKKTALWVTKNGSKKRDVDSKTGRRGRGN